MTETCDLRPKTTQVFLKGTIIERRNNTSISGISFNKIRVGFKSTSVISERKQVRDISEHLKL